MARPQKEGLDYFPHDTDACTDEKVEALMMVYGTKGYAFYFILLERIYRTSNCELNISDAETIQILSKKIGINTEEFNLILKSAIKYKCFDRTKYENESILTSKGIKNRANIVIEKRIKMREKYGNTTLKVSDAETREETREETRKKPDKEKKRKEKKSKEIYSVFFENLWALYPEKKGKADIKPKQIEELEKIGYETLVRCINRYKKDKPDWKQWQNGSTFFNKGYIDYLDANYSISDGDSKFNPYKEVD